MKKNSLCFGQLSQISTVFLFFARLGYDAAIIPVSLITYNIVYYFICLVFFTTFFQMILVTLYGIYYLADRMQLEYERTKVYYKQSFQNLREETSIILKHIAIPTIKNELMADKLEKKVFYHFPFFVLNNKVLFRKIGTLEKIILRKTK